MLDDSPRTVEVVAAGTEVYQRYADGEIWHYLGPVERWEQLDNNPITVEITAAPGVLYQRHSDGEIWQYLGPGNSWKKIDNNPLTVGILAVGTSLFQRHSDGSVWLYTGTALTGWQQIGNNATSVAVAASDGDVYQPPANGTILLYEGQPLGSWQVLDSNPATIAVTAAGVDLYQLHSDATIWQYTGHLLDIDSGPCGPSPTPTPTTDQRRLFAIRDIAKPDEVVVYFVRSVYASSGVQAGVLNGCASYPADEPGVAVAQIASAWTMTHEVGHVLGLPHITGEKNSAGVCVTPDPRRLMTGCSTSAILAVPGLSGAEIATMTASPYVHPL